MSILHKEYKTSINGRAEKQHSSAAFFSVSKDSAAKISSHAAEGCSRRKKKLRPGLDGGELLRGGKHRQLPELCEIQERIRIANYCSGCSPKHGSSLGHFELASYRVTEREASRPYVTAHK